MSNKFLSAMFFTAESSRQSWWFGVD